MVGEAHWVTKDINEFDSTHDGKRRVCVNDCFWKGSNFQYATVQYELAHANCRRYQRSDYYFSRSKLLISLEGEIL